MTPAGYMHPLYAEALSEFGTPVALTSSGGWLLGRRLPATGDHDAMGPYPLFCCADWNALRQDLDTLRGRLVSVVLVADPFGEHKEEILRASFDRVLPFKTHFAVDLDRAGPVGSKHHQNRARRALRDVAIEVCPDPVSRLGEWVSLYSHLTERHALTGIRAFSPESFRRQFEVPGLVLLRATSRSGECVGAQLWFLQGEAAYSHLTAANAEGYRCACTYALYDAAIRHFRGTVRWLDLGGGAGSQQN
ncbi:MAG TPA: GNAT family N-acetyltransferase, partial [Candidatus Sulfopaludibacter sp.]|nr:GNAT family N-acetyltransferase [Candidatus Sulfopaludibacter sp.]